jgi:hypothetical protein
MRNGIGGDSWDRRRGKNTEQVLDGLSYKLEDKSESGLTPISSLMRR